VRTLTIIAVLLSSLLTLVTSSQAQTSSRVLEQSLWYQSGNLRIRAHLFMPNGSSRLPVVLYNHGGITGLSEPSKRRCRELAQAGFMVFASSYRGEDGSDGKVEVAKGEVDDVLAGLTWVKKHPRADANRIATLGTSHGALVGLIAASRVPDFKALVFAYGVSDINAWYEYLVRTNQLEDDQLTRDTYGNGPADRPESFAIRRGLNYVPRLPSTMPVLILQGAKDLTVPPEQATALHEMLVANGKTSSLKIYPNSEHGFLMTRESALRKSRVQGQESLEAFNEAVRFLKTNLR
jgi:dipeptidyl aminopeptidase/acylaminoacyl peptidase